MGYQLGVDIGTSYSAAAVNRGGAVEVVTLTPSNPVMPSVVLLKQNGEVLVGETAVRRGIDEPTRVARAFKRRLGDPTPLVLGGTPYGAESLMAHLLTEVVRVVSEREGAAPDRVVLTHPANYGPYKLDQMREVARLAGLDLAKVSFVTEPEAAAISYAATNRVEPGEVVAVYDFGGGTFDAALVRRDANGFSLIGRPEGMDRLGGIDIDAAILEYVDSVLGGRIEALDPNDRAVQSGVSRLNDDCRLAKEALSTDTDTTISVSLPGLQDRVPLSRAQLEAMIRPRINETIDALVRAVATADLDISQVGRVLLVGGSSRIPLVAELVHERTGLPVSLDAHPKFAIATGAAAVEFSASTSPTSTPVPVPLPLFPSPGSPPVTAVPAVPAVPAEPALGTSPAQSLPGPTDSAQARKRRTRLLVAAGAVAVVVAVAAIVVVASGGSNNAATVAASTSSPTLVVATSASPSTADQPAGTAAVRSATSATSATSASETSAATTSAVTTIPATTVAALPAALTFSDRIGFAGREGGGVFKIEVTKAEVIEADHQRTAVMHTKVSNLAAVDIALGLIKSPVLLLADGSLLSAKFKALPTVPGGGTTAVDIVAPVDESFTFTGAALVFGNSASNQSIIPFDTSAKVTTFTPIVDIGKGTTVDSGAGTVATITGGVLHADYKDGSKDSYQLELAVDVTYKDPTVGTTSDIQQTFTLALPDGTSASSSFGTSLIFNHGNQIVASGSTEKQTMLFEVTSTYYGQYTLTIGHQRSQPPNPKGNLTFTFTVAQQP